MVLEAIAVNKPDADRSGPDNVIAAVRKTHQQRKQIPPLATGRETSCLS